MFILDHRPGRNQSASQLWAYVTIDKEGNEGLCGANVGGQWLPMTFTRWDLVERFRPCAIEAAAAAPQGTRIVLRSYSQATDLEEIK